MKPFETRLISVLEAIRDELRGMRSDAREPVPIICTHPEDERDDMSTFGHPSWRCKVCGHQEPSI